MERGTTYKIFEKEVKRLKEEVRDGQSKVEELRKELSQKEEKIRRQNEQLGEYHEIMLEQQSRMEELEGEPRRNNEELLSQKADVERSLEQLKQCCVVAFGAFKVLAEELTEHFQQCCEKRGRGVRITRRLGEVTQLIKEKIGEGGGVQGEIVQLRKKRKVRHPKLKKVVQHSRDKNRVGGYYCVCGAKFSRLTRLNTHIKVNIGAKKWRCGVCALKFYFLRSLRKHEGKMHGVVGGRQQRRRSTVAKGGMFKCEECSDEFEVMAELLKHQKNEHSIDKKGQVEVYHGDRGEQMEDGDRDTLTEDEDVGVLTADEEREMMTEEEETGTEDEDRGMGTEDEDQAGLTGDDDRAMSTEDEGHEPEDKRSTKNSSMIIQLPPLNLSIIRPPPPRPDFAAAPETKRKKKGKGRRLHMDDKDKVKHAPDTSKTDPGFYCLCGKSFPYRHSLALHIKANNKGKLVWQCSACNQGFPYRSWLVRHEKSIHGKSEPVMKARKVAKLLLSNVPAIAKGRRCHKCTDNRRFATLPELLKHHQQAHGMTKSKPGSGRKEVTVTTVSSLNTKATDPMVTKKARGRPKGAVNKKGVKQEEDVSKSELGLVNDNKFECTECQKRFPYLSFLRRHEVSVHGAQRTDNGIGCSMCGEKFSKLTDLYQHKKSIHAWGRNSVGNTGQGDLPDGGNNGDNASAPRHSLPLSLPSMSNVARSILQKKETQTNSKATPPSASPSKRKSMSRVEEEPTPSTSGTTVGVLLAKKQSKTPKSAEHGIDPSNPRQCFCGYSNILIFSVKRHVDKMTKLNVTEQVEQSPKARKEKQFPCQECNEVFTTQKSLDEHGTVHKRMSKTSGYQKINTTSGTGQPKVNSMPKLVVSRVDDNVEASKSLPILSPQNVSPSVPSRASLSMEPVKRKKKIRSSEGRKFEYATAGKSKLHAVDHSRRDEGFFCVCGSSYKSELLLDSHVKYFCKEKKFPCHLCPKRCTMKSLLQRHLLQCHKISGEEVDSTQVENSVDRSNIEKQVKFKVSKVNSTGVRLKRYKCGKCGDVLISRAKLIEHRNAVHGLQSGGRRRKVIQRFAPRKRNLAPPENTDMMAEPIVFEQLGTDSEPIPIPIPIYEGYDTAEEEELDYNQIKVTPAKIEPSQKIQVPILRISMGSSTNTSAEAQRSAPSSTELKPDLLGKHERNFSMPGYRCICGGDFSTMENLQTHIRCKTQPWRFECELCNQRFFYKCLLNAHLRAKHNIVNGTQEKIAIAPEVCRECGKGFENALKLKEHCKAEHKQGKVAKEL